MKNSGKIEYISCEYFVFYNAEGANEGSIANLKARKQKRKKTKEKSYIIQKGPVTSVLNRSSDWSNEGWFDGDGLMRVGLIAQ
jgi:hypothetical protein